MRNRILIMVLVSLYFPLYSQGPSIGKSNFFQKNVTYLRSNYSPSTPLALALIGTTGENATWDLSAIGDEYLYHRDTCEIIPIADTFPYYNSYYDTTSLLLELRSGETRNYFNFLEGENSIDLVGANPFGAVGTSPVCFQRFIGPFPLEIQNDMTYGFEKSEAVEGLYTDASGSDNHFVNGNITTRLDAYGRIIFPGGDTIQGVLRMKKIMRYIDSNALFGVRERNDTSYFWYSELFNGPCVSIGTGNFPFYYHYNSGFLVYDIDGSRLLSTVCKQSIKPADGTAMQFFHDASLNRSGMVHYGNDMERADCHIYDPSGRTVKSFSIIFSSGRCELGFDNRAASACHLIKMNTHTADYRGRIIHVK